jgi:thiamine monophosphate kinase
LIQAEPALPSAPAASGSDSRRTPPEATADALAEVPALREVRNLTARIEQLLAASGDPGESEALSGYLDRALRRVKIEVEELLEQAASRAT